MTTATKKTKSKEGLLNHHAYSHVREYKSKMSDLLFERIYRLLKSCEMDIIVSTDTGIDAGYIDFENSAIYLNPTYFPIEETLIHEALHIIKPDFAEKDIIELSLLLTEQLTDRRRAHLVNLIRNNAIKCIGMRRRQLTPTYAVA